MASELVLINKDLQGVVEGPTPDFLDDLLGAISVNTRRSYLSALRTFRKHGYTIPASPADVAEYVKKACALTDEGEVSDRPLTAASLNSHLAALSFMHRCFKLPDPTKGMEVELAIRRIRKERGTAQWLARPLLQEDVMVMLKVLRDKSSLINIRDEALILIGWTGAFRRSELCEIEIGDMQFTEEGVVINLRHSKTDQVGSGFLKAIARGRTEREGGVVCPVRSLGQWLSASHLTSGKVFRSVNNREMVGESLTGRSVDRIIKKVARRAYLEDYDGLGRFRMNFSGHSLRAGFCSSCAMKGVPTWQIMKVTGHASEAMVSKYIRDEQLFRTTPTLW